MGSGGMADVYEAADQKLGRRVALKVLPKHFSHDPQMVERFEREVRAAASLNHSGIVTIFEVGQFEDNYFYSMRLLRGGDLRSRLRGGISEKAALRILREVSEAFSHAHAHGFVHRDVKPENILFDEQGRAVLTDFGIAKAMSGNAKLTQTGISIGTPRYIAPEQARGRDVDQRADLYSLGVILYEMLVGRPPYESEDAIGLMMQHIADPIPRLPTGVARYQGLIDQLMAKDAGQRPASCTDLISLIDPFLEADDPRPAAASPLIGTTSRWTDFLNRALRRRAAPTTKERPATDVPPTDWPPKTARTVLRSEPKTVEPQTIEPQLPTLLADTDAGLPTVTRAWRAPVEPHVAAPEPPPEPAPAIESSTEAEAQDDDRTVVAPTPVQLTVVTPTRVPAPVVEIPEIPVPQVAAPRRTGAILSLAVVAMAAMGWYATRMPSPESEAIEAPQPTIQPPPIAVPSSAPPVVPDFEVMPRSSSVSIREPAPVKPLAESKVAITSPQVEPLKPTKKADAIIPRRTPGKSGENRVMPPPGSPAPADTLATRPGPAQALPDAVAAPSSPPVKIEEKAPAPAEPAVAPPQATPKRAEPPPPPIGM